MTSPKPDRLAFTIECAGRTFVHVRVGLVASFYLTSPLPDQCLHISRAIEAYIKLVGRERLACYFAEDGEKKVLSDRRLERDLKLLRNLPKSAEGFDLEYSSEPTASVGDYGIKVVASERDEDFEDEASLVRFEFSHDTLEVLGERAVLDFMLTQAGQLRSQSGNAGLGFKRATGFEDEATATINALLPRYLAIDPCFDDAADLMRGHAPSAHWISFVDRDLYATCGGDKVRLEVAPGVLTTEVDDVIALRASRLPPIGDKNRRAEDIGCLPDLARFLAPVRVPLDGLGDDDFEVAAWLGRFDSLPSRNWNNS